MKRLLAILFIVALVWAQAAPGICVRAATAAAGQPACPCCHCGKASCCMNKTAPQRQPLPAAPAPRGSQSGQLLLFAPAALAFVLPQPASAVFAFPTPASSRAASVPLYQRDCLLLI